MNKADSKEFLIRSSRTKYLKFRSHQLISKSSPSESKFVPEFVRMCPWETEAFFELFAAHARAGAIEIGRFNGGSTLAMTMANGTVPIVSIDISPQDDDTLKQVFNKLDLGSNVKLVIGDSRKTSVKNQDGSDFKFDFLFIDGDHSRAGCLADIAAWWPRLGNGGIMVLHDCYASHDKESCETKQGVLEATLEFLRENKCTVLINPTFHDRPWEKPNGSLFVAMKN